MQWVMHVVYDWEGSVTDDSFQFHGPDHNSDKGSFLCTHDSRNTIYVQMRLHYTVISSCNIHSQSNTPSDAKVVSLVWMEKNDGTYYYYIKVAN